GGTFRWLANGTYSTNPTDDGGFYIASTNGSNGAGIWERVLAGDTPNVKMWGAKGDNSTDDTTAIRNAVGSYHGDDGVRRCGNRLLFPAGKYRISDTIVFQNNLHLQG